ncbi:helix-turn-helix domain-containing protein [Kineobactrum salinum]|uniref:Helix-turn-helix transcriptional regulator n=1 Tax=Kineobactrum salinum TaxID=2708301 RepID=A0A6C0TZK6_9GAMM|nr:AraC family transcriptional regulator [Kineobactrum salinum]QIB65088.1 helix-turn-helix transcriptional regulator [Kineobactrum salinum]
MARWGLPVGMPSLAGLVLDRLMGSDVLSRDDVMRAGRKMYYGDEFVVPLALDTDPDKISAASLGPMFRNAQRLTRFSSTPDQNPIHDPAMAGFQGTPLSYRISEHQMIEINECTLESPLIIRNQVSDLISFQFVSSIKRSEFVGSHRHNHDLGPALIVTVVPQREITYRVPKTGVPIRHVVVFATLSGLLERMRETPDDYPAWLVETLAGRKKKVQQRVFFLDDVHREPIWSCFNLPVSGSLLGPWMAAKSGELLCIGLQILKNSQTFIDRRPLDLDLPYAEKILRARTILSSEYPRPPSLRVLARQLGISETQLKSGFKSMNGITVMQYCISKRIDAAKLLLKDNRHSVSEVGDIVGYEDHSAFSRAFRRLTGCSPQDWRRTWGQ